MSTSILTGTKKILGIEEDYTAFDHDIITHINSVFTTLNQLGLGPIDGFMIEDKVPVWSDFLSGDATLNSVKTYVYLRVRLLFDPPSTSYVITSLQEQIRELEWRLSIRREERDHQMLPEGFDAEVDAGDLSSGVAPAGEVLTSDGLGNADWDPITRILTLDVGQEPPPGTPPGTIIFYRLS